MLGNRCFLHCLVRTLPEFQYLSLTFALYKISSNLKLCSSAEYSLLQSEVPANTLTHRMISLKKVFKNKCILYIEFYTQYNFFGQNIDLDLICAEINILTEGFLLKKAQKQMNSRG